MKWLSSAQKQTFHHIVPTSRWWLKWVNNNNSILLEQVSKHAPLHAAFGNAFPDEQIIEILNIDTKKIKNSKKEDLLSLLETKKNEIFYFPWIITNLEDFYYKDYRTGQIYDVKKANHYQDIFFWAKTLTENRILEVLNISSSALIKDFKENILKIIS